MRIQLDRMLYGMESNVDIGQCNWEAIKMQLQANRADHQAARPSPKLHRRVGGYICGCCSIDIATQFGILFGVNQAAFDLDLCDNLADICITPLAENHEVLAW